MKNIIWSMLVLCFLDTTAYATDLDMRFKNLIQVTGMPTGTGVVEANYFGGGITLHLKQEVIRYLPTKIQGGTFTINGISQTMPLPSTCLVNVTHGLQLDFLGVIEKGKKPNVYCQLHSQ